MSQFDDGWQLGPVVEMPRGMTPEEVEHFLDTGEAPPMGTPPNGALPVKNVPTAPETGFSEGEAIAFLAGYDTVADLTAGFDPHQPRDDEGRWTVSPHSKIHGMWSRLSPNTSQKHADAIHAYTQSDYEPINDFLRNKTEISMEQLTTASRLLEALRYSDHDMLLLRGTTTRQLGVTSSGGDILEKLKKREGKTFAEKGMMSTTITMSALDELEHDVVLEIETPKNTPMIWARPYAETPEEDEVIVAPGKYQIISVRAPDASHPDGTRAVVRVRRQVK